MFELMSELPWRPEKFTKEEWIRGYVKARYGKADEDVLKAWDILIHSIYNCPAGNNQQGPHESIFCGRPTLHNFQASSWSKMKNYYNPDDTRVAAELMVKAAERFRGNNNFEYDLVDICRQALADQARVQYLQTIADFNAFRKTAFDKDAKRFLEMLLLQDKLLGTRKEFRLGRWLTDARSCSTIPAEQDLYEWNARVQITTWGNRTCANEGGLRDYAHKEWNGLLKDFYYMRWKTYLDGLSAEMEMMTKPRPEMLGGGENSNKTADELFQMALPQDLNIDYYALEEPWTVSHNQYKAEPEGNPVDVAKEVMEYLKP